MQIGVVKEIKDREHRVALTPEGAGQLVEAGHDVVIEDKAGAEAGFSNVQYEQQGARIGGRKHAWESELVLKIKEPQETEYRYFSNNILFTYLHLSGVTPNLTTALLQAGTTAIAYETVEDEHGRFPLLAPMSAIAGNMAASIGNYYLAKFNGGRGVQMGSVQGQRHG
ncbi:MAG: alanine dehydrogenase, partial [Gammaproteobacteria bacterium]|nr:alanine dehydrogenase [Gammaproteobacteria bacterium]